jgi:hypothetical protein
MSAFPGRKSPSPFTIPEPKWKVVEDDDKHKPHRLTVGMLIANLRRFADEYESYSAYLNTVMEPAARRYDEIQFHAAADVAQRMFRSVIGIVELQTLLLRRYGEELTLESVIKIKADLVSLCGKSISEAEAVHVDDAANLLLQAYFHLDNPIPPGEFVRGKFGGNASQQFFAPRYFGPPHPTPFMFRDGAIPPDDSAFRIATAMPQARVDTAPIEPEPAKNSMMVAVEKAGLSILETKLVSAIAKAGGKLHIPDAELLLKGHDALSALNRAKPKMAKVGWTLNQNNNHYQLTKRP